MTAAPSTPRRSQKERLLTVLSDEKCQFALLVQLGKEIMGGVGLGLKEAAIHLSMELPVGVTHLSLCDVGDEIQPEVLGVVALPNRGETLPSEVGNP